jgi:tRNA-2-methylthio-N6-dimethylallyladenosine synthase
LKKRLYIETYGCQMNFSDSEIVASVMQDSRYELTDDHREADAIFINTCSIRENAEQRIRKRLRELKSLKKKRPGLQIGILGCMAERLKEQLFEEEESVDLIAGPDAYRDLPRLLTVSETGQKAANVLLSEEETYSDLEAVRYGSNGISAFISIMRGCENFCSYCVVPYTRGKERSRNPESIVQEARQLFNDGYREVTLLGQNVNSYKWKGESGFLTFPDLIKLVAAVSPLLRVRFATSHPKDLSDSLIDAIASVPNICRHVHLPVQSGSSEVLKRMNRKYDREWYLERISALKAAIPDVGLSTDLIAGFCGEKEEDHIESLSLMREVGYDFAFMFKYSERPGTRAFKTMKDDVEEEVKKRRLDEIIQLQLQLSLESNQRDVGKVFTVLADSISKKSDQHLSGRNEQNKVVVFPKENYHPGEYIDVRITSCTSATLLGEAVK